MARPKKSVEKTTSNYLGRIETEIQSNQSRLNMVLGALIVLVVGILIFNYFNRSKSDLGPAQSTTQEQQDVAAENLPGKYTVKEDDTLFIIAAKYYQDGYKYTEIAKANNILDPNTVVVGQVLDIPKLENAQATVIATETPAPSASPSINPTPTDWGPKIVENTYTVVEGDWLSTIAARAYGDIYTYQKIADANHISNPDLIEPGQILTLPR